MFGCFDMTLGQGWLIQGCSIFVRPNQVIGVDPRPYGNTAQRGRLRGPQISRCERVSLWGSDPKTIFEVHVRGHFACT